MKKPGLPIKYAIYGLVTAFAVSTSAATRHPEKESADSLPGGISVLYAIGSAHLDPSLGSNAQHLENLTSWLDRVMACDSMHIASLTIFGSASPDGATAFNVSLAQQRAMALERYVRSHVQLPDSVVHLSSHGVDWLTLADYVKDSDLRGRKRILDIINNQPELTYNSKGRLIDSRRKRLMDMNGGRTWREMEARWFPYMRSASVMVAVTNRKKRKPETVSEEKVVQADSLKSEAFSFELGSDSEDCQEIRDSIERKPFYMSVQTNMLYDALLLPTLGTEFYLGKGWSIAGNWTYGWWSANRHNRFWRAYGGYLAGRKWFGTASGRKPLTGHHAGIYAQLLTYDFEFGGAGQMAGAPGESLWDSPSYAFGIEYGYSLPIAKRLNIDFTIGVGYLGGKYYKYHPVDGHYVWQGTARRNYFGPTNAQISLVWLIGRDNTNSTKE